MNIKVNKKINHNRIVIIDSRAMTRMRREMQIAIMMRRVKVANIWREVRVQIKPLARLMIEPSLFSCFSYSFFLKIQLIKIQK